MTETTGKHAATPTLTALEFKGFAAGVQKLAEQIETGRAEDASREEQLAALDAANALLRNAPMAKRTLRRLEGFAHEIVATELERNEEAMSAFFGADQA
jgi:esterase/lipase